MSIRLPRQALLLLSVLVFSRIKGFAPAIITKKADAASCLRRIDAGRRQQPHYDRRRSSIFMARRRRRNKSRATSPLEYNFSNFWIATNANFTAYNNTADEDDIMWSISHHQQEPDFISRSGSVYWDTGDAVIRQANHWTGQHDVYKIVDCSWTLDVPHTKGENATGVCYYKDFGQVRIKGRKTLKQRGIVVRDKQQQNKVELVQIKISFANFWQSTQATFTTCPRPDREPDFQSRSNSSYWDTGNGAVVRASDHWTGQFGVTNIVNCYWSIDQEQTAVKEVMVGSCFYDDFVKRKRKGAGGSKKTSWRKFSH